MCNYFQRIKKLSFMQFLTLTVKAHLSSIVYVVLCMLCGEMCNYTTTVGFQYINSLILWNSSERKLDP